MDPNKPNTEEPTEHEYEYPEFEDVYAASMALEKQRTLERLNGF